MSGFSRYVRLYSGNRKTTLPSTKESDMKLHHSLATTLAVTVTASVLLAGGTTAISARDNAGVRRMEPRTVQKRNNTPSRQKQYSQQAVRKQSPKVVSRANTSKRYDRKFVRELPRGYRTIHTGGHQYYSHNGVYYTRYNHGFTVVSAPRINRLPRHARRVNVNRTIYYVYDNVYYRPRGGYYEVCEIPHYRSSLEFNAGPVRVVLTDHDCSY